MGYGEELEQIDQRFPSGWQGHMLQFKRLESMIRNESEEPREESDANEDFFTVLSNEVSRINA